MSVRFEWSDATRIVVYCTIEHPWTWQENQTVVDAMSAEMRQVTHPIATIVDAAQMKAIPKSGSIMQNLQRVENMLPDNVFGSVIVGAPHIVVTFMNVLTQIKPRAKRITMFANTVEEAHQMLAKRHDMLFPELHAENKFAITRS